MADADREEKLAAARKKLKKFQQKRTPSSPTVRELKPPLLNSSIDSPNSSESVGIPLTTESHGNISPHEEAAGLQPINGAYRLEDNSAQTHQALESNHRGGPSSTTLNDREHTTTEKIKQLCRQINGLMSQDFYINGEDPVFHEIESLENRNHQLEERVQSYKRSNDQLNNQVNEQRRQIIQFQEQIKRERTELANKQLLEQRSLKEQLEVHIQTIGILVGEKQELQSTVSQLQRKYDIKQSENSELTSRLQTVRQKAGELEKNLANITATCEKHQDDAKRFRQERDKYQTATYTQNQEKEELLQQNAELRVKLEAKLAECEQLNKNESELSLKLKQAELVVQQLSGEPSSSETHNLVQQLQTEKTDLESKLEQVNATIQKIAAEKGELLQQRADEVDQYERRIRSLTEEAETCEREKKALILRETELHNSLQSLQKELADLRDKEATNQMESTQLAAAEIERLAEDKQRLAEHLQKEGRENDRLVREQERYVLRIQELESALSRMGEEAIDKATLLETAQSDKETISRALKQNKELKEKMEELEERFVTMSQENMNLTTSLETERHAAKELASKLSGTGVELEEAKQLLFSRTDEIQALREELNVTSENLREQVTEGENMVSSLRDELDISSQQWQEQLRHKDFEISAVREELELSSQGLAEQLARKDVELASLKNELTHSEARLTEQFLLNENNEEFKNQSEVLNTLQHQLLIAQNTINQLTAQNAELQEMLRNTENSGSMEPSGTESSDEDEASKRAGNGSHVHHIHTVATDSEGGEILVKRLPPDVIPVQAPERMLEESPPYLNGTFSEGESPAETDSSEDMNMTPHRPLHPPHPSKYTNREDVVDSLSASIRQLEMERDQLTDILHRTRDESEDDFQRLHQHMQLQLNQQLQQQYRQVQEQFQQQLHEQQQKIQLLQAVVEKQKSQIEKKEEPELPNIPLEQLERDDMSHDAIKMAFSKLQARFMKLMNEKASLIERIQELEHITVQLSMETETIGEYITLYQTQRNALKSHYKDRERLITQLSSEKANMQEKMNQLQDLVKQMLDERKELRLQQHQLQSVINSKMVAHEHQSAIPSFQDGDEVIVQQEQTEVASERNTMDNGELWSKSFLETETELSGIDNSEQFDQNDGTAHQILQILEQLGPTEEGTQSGWMSPDVRCREFLPCRYCGGRVLRL
ncbi:golgin subfamily A member 2-like isoform X1 [Montipora foliosa]|uniref:golgin subfamily A member 2-like isoform X1 n=1 Tax=Montipora foliosa TaxID=591990 RepID=UPI0035F20B5C